MTTIDIGQARPAFHAFAPRGLPRLCAAILTVAFGLGVAHSGDLERPPWHCRDPKTNLVYLGPQGTQPCATGDLLIDKAEYERSLRSQWHNQNEDIALVEANGVYKVPVVINGVLPLKFTVDSGATDVAITKDVFLVLNRTGTVSREDYIGTTQYRLADGSTIQSDKFFLRELKVGDRVLKHVEASIGDANPDTPLLLGQSFLRRFASVQIDNIRHVLQLGAERTDIIWDEPSALSPPPPGAHALSGDWVLPPAPPGSVPLSSDRTPTATAPRFDPSMRQTVMPRGTNAFDQFDRSPQRPAEQ